MADDQQDLATAFRSRTTEQQKALLAKMNKDQKANLAEALKRSPMQVAGPTDNQRLEGTVKTGRQKIMEMAPDVLPAVGATVGGTLGGLAGVESGPGAFLTERAGEAVGGAAGEAGRLALRRGMGLPTPHGGLSVAGDIAAAGGVQAAWGTIGKAFGSVVGAALSKVKPFVGEMVGGEAISETMGQASGQGPAGRYARQAEKYLAGTFMGHAIDKVRLAQEDAFRGIVANLSKVNGANPAEVAANWAQAREVTRMMADPMYDALRKIESEKTAAAAADLVKNSSLPSDVRESLVKASGVQGGSAEQYAKDLAKSLGYSDYHDPALMKQLPPDIQKALQSSKTTVGDALAARSKLRDLAVNTADKDQARIYKQAWEKLDNSINASLTPQQKAMKDQADLLWRRSYIMDDVYKHLSAMTKARVPGEAGVIPAKAFTEMVNELSVKEPTHHAGKLMYKPSELEVLFSDPADRKAMTDLATFMTAKYAPLAGQTGLSESIARVGTMLAATGIVGHMARGNVGAGVAAGASLTGLWALSNVLAKPGGAKLVQEYLAASIGPGKAGSEAVRYGALVVKEAMTAYEEQHKQGRQALMQEAPESIRGSFGTVQ